MLVSAVIKSAMRKLGLVASGEDPTPSEYTDGLEALQSMLRLWSSKKILVFASTRETVTLVPGQAAYTWGSGGNITTDRPHALTDAFVRDSNNTDYDVSVITEGRYNSITNKDIGGRPSYAFLHPLYPLAYLYLYPTPDTADTIHLDSLKPFTETSSFSDISDTLAIPVNYEEPIIANLAVRIAPEYGKSVSVEIASLAASGYDFLIGLNSSNQVEPITLSLPVCQRGAYDINQG